MGKLTQKDGNTRLTFQRLGLELAILFGMEFTTLFI
jgi:hypothetical protein